ncbi:MAG: hypothetical protein K2W95_34295 [Candidatus Obscuribacterales bacterium]|nr:hypothetical protein [Candidatus Obscuribacterales bacterium]
MLTAYRAYNYISCIVIISVIALAVSARHSEICQDLGVYLFYSWGLVSVMMAYVAFFSKFNKLPAAFYPLLIFWSPVTNAFFPSAPSTLSSGITVNMLAGACLLLIPHYICGQSTDGKGDVVMQGFEDVLLNPVSVGIMTVGWLPASFLAAMTGFHID